MLANAQQCKEQVYACYTSALEVQKGKLIRDDNIIKALTAYRKTLDAWAKRGEGLYQKNASRTEWEGWIKAGEIHSSACKEWGAYSPGIELITAIWDTAKEAPKHVVADVGEGAKKAGEVASAAVSGLVSGAMPGILIIGVVIAGYFILKSKV